MSDCRQLATVVIVNYNYEAFVADAIDSALAQSYQPVEVVVVDDGSTDGSRGVMARYGTRIRTVFKSNGGQGSAYNAGWFAARGDFILFLDSDDVLTEDAMEKTVEAFNRSDAVKVQFFLSMTDRNLKPLGRLLPSYGFTTLEPRKQISNYGYYLSPPASGNAFRKSFLDQVMPIADEAMYRRAPDGYTTGLAGLTGRIESIPQTLGFYRLHGNNAGGESGVKSLSGLHHMFMRDTVREATQHAFADKFDFQFKSDRSRFCPGHTKLRLLSLRLVPESHPIKTDTTAGLTLNGLRSALTYPHLNLRKRVSVALGFMALGLMPRALLRKYFDTIVAAQKVNAAAVSAPAVMDGGGTRLGSAGGR